MENDRAAIRTANVAVDPAPTDEEAVAIAAAMAALWPRPSPVEPAGATRNTAWRFSSRNWARPLPVRRLRPWR